MDPKPLNIKLLYIVAISTILAVLFVNQLVIPLCVKNQSQDATWINLARKGRMFSQNVAITSLRLLHNKGGQDELMNYADNNEIASLYTETNPIYQKMAGAATLLAENPNQINQGPTVDTILSNEKFFLTTMDKVISQYQVAAKGKVRWLVTTEIGLAVLLLLILLFEMDLIFRPVVNVTRKVNKNLLATNKKLKDTTRKLFRNEGRLRETQRLGRIGSLERDISTDKICWSDGIFEIFDVNPQQFDVSYGAYLDLIHPEYQAAVDASVRRTLKGKLPLQAEYGILNVKGEIKHVKGKGSLMVDDPGNAVKVKGVVQRITDQKVAMDALRKSEQNLKEVERIGKIGSWELDVPLDTLYCSDEFLRIFQLEKGEIARGHIIMLERIHPEDRDRVQKAMNDNFEKQVPYHIEYRIIVGQRLTKYVSARAETYFDVNGSPLVMRGVVLDVTDRKEHERMSSMINQKQNELEKRQGKMNSLAILEGEEKERMRFSMELHDGVGQILTALKIHVKILAGQELGNGGEYYKKLLNDVKNLVNNAIFEIRRISNNLTPKLLMDFGLTEGIDNLISILLERADIKITKNIELGDNRYKEHVEISLFRIMQEVLQNVIKHAEACHVTIALKEDDSSIELKVVDDGKGFDVNTIKHRSDQNNGLTNIKHRIDLLNGQLYVKSAVGRGCEILVNIPLN